MNRSVICALLLALPTLAMAGNTVHRWVDEHGTVNYGDRPPEGRRTTPVPTSDPLGVSGSPAAKPVPAAPTESAATAPPDREAVRQEVESALRRERAADALATERRQEAARLEARRRCEEQRRVDCDQAAVIDDTIYLAPPRILRRHQPGIPVVPTSPPTTPAAPPLLMKRGPVDTH
jgi:type IV secretory pathway VirB10-like protein